jgi:arsenite-transporting ATPase
VFDALERLHADLDDVRAVLTGPETSVRLVLTPESVVLAEARRAYTFLTLFGYSVDAAIVNRVFPENGADEWRRAWVESQRRQLQDAADSFAGLEIRTSVYRASEPVGQDDLLDLAASVYDARTWYIRTTDVRPLHRRRPRAVAPAAARSAGRRRPRPEG